MIQGIGHGHEHMLRRFFQGNRPRGREKLRRHPIGDRRSLRIGLGGRKLQIEFLCEGFRQIALGEHSQLHQQRPEPLAAVLLQAPRLLELVGFELTALHQQLAEAGFQRRMRGRLGVGG